MGLQCQNEWVGSGFVGPSFQPCVLLVQMDLTGETMTGWVWGRQGPWECPATSVQFFCKHKTVLKNKAYLKTRKKLRFWFICFIYSQMPQVGDWIPQWPLGHTGHHCHVTHRYLLVQLSITLGLTSQQKHLLFKARETGVRWTIWWDSESPRRHTSVSEGLSREVQLKREEWGWGLN